MTVVSEVPRVGPHSRSLVRELLDKLPSGLQKLSFVNSKEARRAYDGLKGASRIRKEIKRVAFRNGDVYLELDKEAKK